MSTIHETAKITSKGQITLPKPIRQALGIGFGGKVAFDVHGSQVIITRAENSPHQNPAIESFLALLEADVRHGQNLLGLLDDLTQVMLATQSSRLI